MNVSIESRRPVVVFEMKDRFSVRPFEYARFSERHFVT